MTIDEAINWLKLNECCIITENNLLKQQMIEWLEELKDLKGA